MKKINAFYCIKTPSEWKERALMNEKKTEKIKLKGFQVAGAVLAAFLLVVGGALTLMQGNRDVEIKPVAVASSSQENESSQTENIENLGEAADKALQRLILDNEIILVGTFAGSDSSGHGCLFVDKVYTYQYGTEQDELGYEKVYDLVTLLAERRIIEFVVDFGIKDKTTGKAVYAQNIEPGSVIAIGTKFEENYYMTAYDIVTHLDASESWQGDGMGTQLYSELYQSFAAAYGIDVSTAEGGKKLKQYVMKSVATTGCKNLLIDCGVDTVLNYKERKDSFGIDLQDMGNCTAIDDRTGKVQVNFPIAATPLKDYKNAKAEIVKKAENGAVVKIGERYYSITSNCDDAIDNSNILIDNSNDGFDDVIPQKSNMSSDDKRWILNVRFVYEQSAFYGGDFKIYINEVENGEKLSDKTEDSDVVITYQSINSRSGEVVLINADGSDKTE